MHLATTITQSWQDTRNSLSPQMGPLLASGHKQAEKLVAPRFVTPVKGIVVKTGTIKQEEASHFIMARVPRHLDTSSLVGTEYGTNPSIIVNLLQAWKMISNIGSLECKIGQTLPLQTSGWTDEAIPIHCRSLNREMGGHRQWCHAADRASTPCVLCCCFRPMSRWPYRRYAHHVGEQRRFAGT